ncbi:TrgA family protein [Pseudoponticoccus marisrubri]|uniref:Tellurium resistance protein n=1 Tax=Pseudoponticoccus marisrubri TaxID=1685382 RepID=A0A0W7WET2_9RHOB|nr:TrgA family protein [Pseudoponticoccus marisrubri]KUF09058.1 tellurium resistance protein [Pseudoponticoccus marisrubri]
MPTAAKLVAALCLALLALVASEMIKGLMPDGTAFGSFTLVNMVIGVLMGWFVIGARSGRGLSAAISNGFTGTVALVFWGLFVQAVNEMVRLALGRRYDSPLEAIGAVFELIAEYGEILLHGPLIALLIIGGILAGLAAEMAAKRWR